MFDVLTQKPWNERDWSKRLAKKLGGLAEYRLPNGARVDILTESTAYEVEWSDKWPEAIGQALFYAHSTNRQPGIILLLRGNYEEDYLQCLAVVSSLRSYFSFELETINGSRS